MWVLIITMLFYTHPIEGKFSSSVSSVTFKSQKSCNAARDQYAATFNPVADSLNKIAHDEEAVGQLRGPVKVVVSTICVAQ